jgi:hypothetical protein
MPRHYYDRNGNYRGYLLSDRERDAIKRADMQEWQERHKNDAEDQEAFNRGCSIALVVLVVLAVVMFIINLPVFMEKRNTSAVVQPATATTITAVEDTGVYVPPRRDWTVPSLGTFRCSPAYQMELWRDRSSGELLGRIFRIVEGSGDPAGNLENIVGNGTTGSLKFTAHIRGEDIRFDGAFQGTHITGTIWSSDFPKHAVKTDCQPGELQYRENFETRAAWNARNADIMRCCGPKSQQPIIPPR